MNAFRDSMAWGICQVDRSRGPARLETARTWAKGTPRREHASAQDAPSIDSTCTQLPRREAVAVEPVASQQVPPVACGRRPLQAVGITRSIRAGKPQGKPSECRGRISDPSSTPRSNHSSETTATTWGGENPEEAKAPAIPNPTTRSGKDSPRHRSNSHPETTGPTPETQCLPSSGAAPSSIFVAATQRTFVKWRPPCAAPPTPRDRSGWEARGGTTIPPLGSLARQPPGKPAPRPDLRPDLR